MFKKMTTEQSQEFVTISLLFMDKHGLGPSDPELRVMTEDGVRHFLSGFFHALSAELLEPTPEQEKPIVIPPDAEMLMSVTVPVTTVLLTVDAVQGSPCADFWNELKAKYEEVIKNAPPEVAAHMKRRGS